MSEISEERMCLMLQDFFSASEWGVTRGLGLELPCQKPSPPPPLYKTISMEICQKEAFLTFLSPPCLPGMRIFRYEPEFRFFCAPFCWFSGFFRHFCPFLRIFRFFPEDSFSCLVSPFQNSGYAPSDEGFWRLILSTSHLNIVLLWL